MLVAVPLALPAPAPAEQTASEEAPGNLAPSPLGTGTVWTRAALESAEPLPIVELPGSPPGGPRTATIARGENAATTAFEGVEIPASLPQGIANGKVFGEFIIPLNAEEIEIKKYQCSASVVPSQVGNVILTAAHCVIDPETGTKATAGSLIFIPGYHDGIGPDGKWEVSSFRTTESWTSWAEKKTVAPNEGGDLAFLLLKTNREKENVHFGQNVEEVAGSFPVAFDSACDQAYTQYGYPAESPYDGEVLYSHASRYAGTDPNPAITPKPVKIASDFTRGASGGPWTVGSGAAPTTVSLSAYGYEGQPGYLYGPYFGEAARKVYERAALESVPIGTEDVCAALPESPFLSSPPTVSTPTPGPTPAPSPPPAAEGTPPSEAVMLKVKRVRRRDNGSAVLIAQVNTAGTLKLSGAGVRAESLSTPSAGQYRLIVAPRGQANRRLRHEGRAKVGVKVAFVASGKTALLSRKIALSRPSAARTAQRRESRSHSATSPGGGARSG